MSFLIDSDDMRDNITNYTNIGVEYDCLILHFERPAFTVYSVIKKLVMFSVESE